ncbi:MAG: hypothetical protein KDA61_21865, partial [Planctomycetales bacterium]|nr:hypothetical protein [Planctomycetales bacterium]
MAVHFQSFSRLLGAGAVALAACFGGPDSASAQTTRNDSQPAYRTAARSNRVSRTPYMIGDSPYGPSSSNLAVEGVGLSTLDHPVFEGHRFNVAEANATLPDDRFLFSYRHLHNVSTNTALGATSTKDLDR